MILKRILLSLVLLVLWGLWGGVARADIYSFEDKDGTIHFSNVPIDARYRFKMKERTKRLRHLLYESRRSRYYGLIDRVARQKSLDPALLRAVIQVESAFDPHAVSARGAAGLMQLMPATAKRMGVEDPFHPAQNVEGGARYLGQLLKKYNGRLEWALAAYNAGEQAVDRHNGIPPYPETRDYVRKVLRAYGKSRYR